ncbi:hypothetical protein HPB51_024738 [Rhipicephalus microplus]|uniref:Uncharacterized protein n=1 Tax=Rhipicephalus microplus TaxID=6941 RepID=A0A9J6EJ51_RHIMP|nr:hypothetical protein HPB51_024738 [Rhipicephalus microplus]
MRLGDPAAAVDSAKLELHPFIIDNLDIRNQGGTAPWQDRIKQAPSPATSSGHGGNAWAMCSNNFLLFQQVPCAQIWVHVKEPQVILICASFHGNAWSMRLGDPAAAVDSAELELHPFIIDNLDIRNQGGTAPWQDRIKQAPSPATSSGHGGNAWAMCSNNFLLFQQKTNVTAWMERSPTAAPHHQREHARAASMIVGALNSVSWVLAPVERDLDTAGRQGAGRRRKLEPARYTRSRVPTMEATATDSTPRCPVYGHHNDGARESRFETLVARES